MVNDEKKLIVMISICFIMVYKGYSNDYKSCNRVIKFFKLYD